MLCAFISFAGIAASLFFSTVLHGIMSRQAATASIPKLSECLRSVAGDQRHLMLFACFVGLSLLGGAMYYFSNKRPYQSSLNAITPDIQTPAAVGQYQHGSARWLTEKETAEAFPWFVIDPDDEQIRDLLRSGYEGLDFINVRGDT
jgi:type IV secretion system protein VirD4